MPNHVISEIVLHGVTLDRAGPYLFNRDGNISFSVLLPLPVNFWPGSVGEEHRDAFPGNHLDAARNTWGTKWDAYGDPAARELDGSTILTFQTAWATPRGWICALFNIFNCPITVDWLDEGRENAFREIFTPSKGDILGPGWTTETIESGANRHRHLHKLLWGVEAFCEDSDQENAND